MGRRNKVIGRSDHSVATENNREAESKAEPQESQVRHRQKKRWLMRLQFRQNMQWQTGFAVFIRFRYLMVLEMWCRLPIERSVRKSSDSGVASIFAESII